jgi:hypothetical protein
MAVLLIPILGSIALIPKSSSTCILIASAFSLSRSGVVRAAADSLPISEKLFCFIKSLCVRFLCPRFCKRAGVTIQFWQWDCVFCIRDTVFYCHALKTEFRQWFSGLSRCHASPAPSFGK